MNITEAAQNLLDYFPEELREIPDAAQYPGPNAHVLAAMNAALQEIFGLDKPWVRKDERGVVLNAPASIDIQVTNGSTAAVITVGDWQAWFAGCSVVIAGAAVDNQIRNDSYAAIVLKYPYTGTTGTVTATVYQDSVSVAIDAMQIHEPVRVNKGQIHPMNNAHAVTYGGSTEDYGFHRNTTRSNRSIKRVYETLGTPKWYSVDTWSPSATEAPAIRLRLFPAPSELGFLDYQATITPPRLTDLTSTDDIPVPHLFVESIFLPIALKLLRKSSFWRNTAGEDEIASSYVTALQLLKNSNPQLRSGIPLIYKF
tara:strand:- start:20048 stop:20983 length:936 start_codon:yes stop_codon:yes gene_type:complete